MLCTASLQSVNTDVDAEGAVWVYTRAEQRGCATVLIMV